MDVAANNKNDILCHTYHTNYNYSLSAWAFDPPTQCTKLEIMQVANWVAQSVTIV